MKKLFFIASVLFLASCGGTSKDVQTADTSKNSETAHSTTPNEPSAPAASGTTSTPETGRYKAGDKLNVLAVSGLTLRDKPDIKGAKVAAVPYAASVTVLAEDLFKNAYQSTEMKGFDIKGNWVKVQVNGKEGYLFDGFLSKIAAPKLNDDASYTTYLGQISKMTKCDKKKPKGEENLYDYESCSYENGATFLSKGYEGGAFSKIFLPSAIASFEEAYLIAKALEGKNNPVNLCKYDASKGVIECTEKNGMEFTTVTKTSKGTEVEFSVAD
jgi:hypothetical protein